MRRFDTELGYVILKEDFDRASQRERDWELMWFVYHSNLIEGIDIDPVKTVCVDDFPLEPEPELEGHGEALDYVLENYNLRNPSQEDIKRMHSSLMKGIWERNAEEVAKSGKVKRKDLKKYEEFIENNSGKYRQCKMWVGNDGGVYYRQVPGVMEELERRISSLENATEEDVWRVHNEFEIIHPFVDGNGRTGRLLLNWLSLKYLDRLEIVEGRKRELYYGRIRSDVDSFKKENPSAGFYKSRVQK